MRAQIDPSIACPHGLSLAREYASALPWNVDRAIELRCRIEGHLGWCLTCNPDIPNSVGSQQNFQERLEEK